jgi:hypothetical protein
VAQRRQHRFCKAVYKHRGFESLHWPHFNAPEAKVVKASVCKTVISQCESDLVLQFIDLAVANKPDQDVFPLPVSVLGVRIRARRVRLHTTTTLSICSTQASGRKYLAPSRTSLRKGQNSRQNPSQTNNF